MWSAHTAMTLTQALATALAIVSVTHEYLLITVVLRWVPTVLDTLIPYFLGFSEIWMALAIGHSASWWAGLIILCVSAALAFLYTAKRHPVSGETEESDIQRGDKPSQQSVLSIVARKLGAISQFALAIVTLTISVTLTCLNSFRACPIWVNIGLMACVIIIDIRILTIGGSLQNGRYDRYHLPRWRSNTRWNSR